MYSCCSFLDRHTTKIIQLLSQLQFIFRDFHSFAASEEEKIEQERVRAKGAGSYIKIWWRYTPSNKHIWPQKKSPQANLLQKFALTCCRQGLILRFFCAESFCANSHMCELFALWTTKVTILINKLGQNFMLLCNSVFIFLRPGGFWNDRR